MSTSPAASPALAPGATTGPAPRRAARRWLSADNALSVHLGRAVCLALLFGTWQLGAGRLFDPFFFSTPWQILLQMAQELTDPGFYDDLAVTAFEMALGFGIGALSGISLGVILARSDYVARVLDPILLGLYSIPRVALAPMLIVWFGIGIASKVFLGATLVFFITFFNTLAGVRGVDQAFCDVARVQGATEWQVFTKVTLPSAASWILTSIKISLPFALVGVILGEFMVSSKGLGYRLNAYSTGYNISGALAIVFLMMALMLMLTTVTNIIEARLSRWRPRTEQERFTPRS